MVAANPNSINSLPPAAPGHDPQGQVKRKDGTAHTLNLRHYLDLLREDHVMQTDVSRSWAAGTLLSLGDELKTYDYFDHASILELVYHLRNGVAHGNRFNISEQGKKRLSLHPAHNRCADVPRPIATIFEVKPTDSGPVLFDFMWPGDVIDLLQSIEVYLARLGGAQP